VLLSQSPRMVVRNLGIKQKIVRATTLQISRSPSRLSSILVLNSYCSRVLISRRDWLYLRFSFRAAGMAGRLIGTQGSKAPSFRVSRKCWTVRPKKVSPAFTRPYFTKENEPRVRAPQRTPNWSCSVTSDSFFVASYANNLPLRNPGLIRRLAQSLFRGLEEISRRI